ncbi:MAG TPA: response regulator [Candidatus Omnitrophota bacterium]|nr:response regulator [Candidatus Omnitrophota bacterium]
MDKIKALVVDDKRVIGDLFGVTLGYKGHDIKIVQDGEEAVQLVKKEKFDIVFIDIVMPEPDGVSVLEKIREVAPDLPVVMMSGYSVDEKRHRAMELGAITCLKKPFEMDEVRQVVKLAIGKEI